MTLATDLDWWSQVVVPAALGAGTLAVSGASLAIALSAHRLSARVSDREAERQAARDQREREEADAQREAARTLARRDLSIEIIEWGVAYFAPEPPSTEAVAASTGELHRLRVAVFASGEQDATAVGAALHDLSRARSLAEGLTLEQYQTLCGIVLAEVIAIATVWAHSPDRVIATIERAAENTRGLRQRSIERAAQISADLEARRWGATPD